MTSSRTRIAEWIVLTVAIVARIMATWSYSETLYAKYPLVDASTYWGQAKKLAEGISPFKDGFYQPPGYPLLLSWLQSAAGDSMWWPKGIQLALGLLTTWLVILVGRRLGRDYAPWAGAFAGALYTLHPSVLMYELDLLTPAVTAVAMAFVLLLLAGTVSVWRSLSAGLLLGLASSVHPTFLFAGIAIVPWLWWSQRGQSGALKTAVAAVVGLGLGVAPMTQANIDQFEHVSVTSNNSGINFFMGNNGEWRETSFLRPGLRFRKLALEAEPYKRDGFERNSYWLSRSFSEIAAAPHVWAGTLATKALWSINDVEIPRNEDYRCRSDEASLSWFGLRLVRYGWVFPFAVLGAIGLCRRTKGERAVVVLWVAMHLPMVLFIVADRYRLATWPMVCLLAPLGVQMTIQAWHGWRKGRAFSAKWLWLLPVVAVPWMPIDSRAGKDPAWCAHTAGNLAFMEKDHDKAVELYQNAVSLDFDDWSAHSWLARSLANSGRRAEAIPHLEVILYGFPDSYPTLKYMSHLQEKSGNISDAADYMLRAYAVPGNRVSVGVTAVGLLMRSSREDEAQAILEANPRVARRWAERQKALGH
jgi:hypothetical protein